LVQGVLGGVGITIKAKTAHCGALQAGRVGGGMTKIGIWLRDLGLPQYAQRFEENGVDPSVLRDLTDEDLKELGVLLGHRRRILRAITEAQGGTPTTNDAASTPQDTAERRQLTVMFCDLVDSTALSTRLDPEDMRQVIRAYQEACVHVIPTYDGFLAKYMGDAGATAFLAYHAAAATGSPQSR